MELGLAQGCIPQAGKPANGQPVAQPSLTTPAMLKVRRLVTFHSKPQLAEMGSLLLRSGGLGPFAWTSQQRA
jgi:hypothetical protein